VILELLLPSRIAPVTDVNDQRVHCQPRRVESRFGSLLNTEAFTRIANEVRTDASTEL
jgi:hypothetical protein